MRDEEYKSKMDEYEKIKLEIRKLEEIIRRKEFEMKEIMIEVDESIK